jgi:hypothetical protein
MAMTFVTLVRVRTLVLIAATSALLGLTVYTLLAQAWDKALEREANATARSIAAALASRQLAPDFMCPLMPLGNVQWVRIATGRDSTVFDSRACPFMRDAQPSDRVVVSGANALTAQGDSVVVEAAVWNPVRDRLARDIAAYMCVLCSLVFVFLFALSSAVQKRYAAGIRAVTQQTRPAANAPALDRIPATFEEFADLSHMLRIVRDSVERDIQSSRDERASQADEHAPLCAVWNAGAYALTAVRLHALDESGLAWAWLHEASLHVLLARFGATPAENASDLGYFWRKAVTDGKTAELDSILTAFAPEGHHYCVFDNGEVAPRTVRAHAMRTANDAAGDPAAAVLSTVPDDGTVATGTWLIVRPATQPVSGLSDQRRQS